MHRERAGLCTWAMVAGCNGLVPDGQSAPAVLSGDVEAGRLSTLVEVHTTLSEPATVAVRCVSNDDPDEVFFAENPTPARSHVLRLSGLIPRTSYQCELVPVIPEGAGWRFSYETGAAPSELRTLGVEVDPELGMEGAWTLAPYGIDAFTGTTWLVVWGPDGRPRWWWPTPEGVQLTVEARYDPRAGDIVWGGGASPEGRIRTVDLWEGQTYAWAPEGWQTREFHHDGKRIADGRLLTLEQRRNTTGSQTREGFGIQLHDRVTGRVTFDFDSQRLVDEGALQPGTRDDAWHANWADWQATAHGPEIYVSLCFARQILALDAESGDLLWQLGAGLGWTLEDADGLPLSDEALPQCQHGLEVEGDRILVYDNGQDRLQSSVSEWSIDPVLRVATRLWLWSEPGWQEDYLGDVDYLPGSRILVTRAASLGIGEAEIVDLDPGSGRVGSRLRFDSGGFTYRSERYAGCDLFTSVRACEDLRLQYAEQSSLFGR